MTSYNTFSTEWVCILVQNVTKSFALGIFFDLFMKTNTYQRGCFNLLFSTMLWLTFHQYLLQSRPIWE